VHENARAHSVIMLIFAMFFRNRKSRRNTFLPIKFDNYLAVHKELKHITY